MSSDHHFCIQCQQMIIGLDNYVQHRSAGSCATTRRISDQSGQSSDADQDCEFDQSEDQEIRQNTGLVPPVGYTGGKWKPGQGPADMYKGYRIVDLGEEGSPSLDPVAEKIHNIRLSLKSGVFDAKALIQEQRKCLAEFPFVCRVCPFFSTQMSSFTWHLNSCQHNGQTSVMEMKCQICSFSCHRMADLIQHFNLERKKKTAKSKNQQTTSREEKNVIESEYLKGTIFSCEIKRPIPCSHCDRKFRHRISERIHFRRDHSKTSNAFQQARAEDLHPAAAAAGGGLICPVCSSEHSTRGNLRQHIRRHAPDLRCPSCPRTFSVRADLLKHSAVHSDRKSFQCDEAGCSHSAKSLQTLRKHQKVHRSEKPFKCNECAFSCKLSSNLKRHQRVHSKDKPYACPHCQYRTGNQENMRKHILTSQKHQGLPVYCCDACPFGCNDFSQFGNHMRQRHQRQNIRSIFSITSSKQMTA